MVIKEFITFLKEYKVLSLAVAFVMGEATAKVVRSLVGDVLLPLVAPLFSLASWQDAVLDLGPVHIAYGTFLADLINFIVLAFIVFIIVRKILKLEKGKP